MNAVAKKAASYINVCLETSHHQLIRQINFPNKKHTFKQATIN